MNPNTLTDATNPNIPKSDATNHNIQKSGDMNPDTLTDATKSNTLTDATNPNATKKLGKIMIIGSGPIVIGQSAEFDYSGSQACTSLREEGYETIIVNSNPATIQTDTEIADRVYIEPLLPEVVARIIEKERPDGILAGMGGQTALNVCAELAESGVLDRWGVKLLGTPLRAIQCAEDRELFRAKMHEIGESVPESASCSSIEECVNVAEHIGYPVIVRPAYTLGGTGGGIVHSPSELEEVAGMGLAKSRIHQVLIEECVLNWEEFEYEVMRDRADNCIIVCSMENLDPMGIHTGESIVVAPAQTLSDEMHQTLRDASLKIIRALGIEGGCNIQFAVRDNEYRVIEVNPRVSRSSALASKATGYPIARVAAKIATDMTLDEIPNAITGKTRASFEPALDYVVVKIPRWPFDKFKGANRELGTQMKSTGEAMGIGRTFEEALQKAIRSLDIGTYGLEPLALGEGELEEELCHPTDLRLWAVAEALRRGRSVQGVADLSGYNPFFVHKIEHIVEIERQIEGDLTERTLRLAKRAGFSDHRIAALARLPEATVRDRRRGWGIRPMFNMVDTCAAEFDARTPYYYSTYFSQGGEEKKKTKKTKVVIVGSGPIRIGQGIEFDYCCVHAVQAVKSAGMEAIMINNNPETVSTDADISDRLYFEPLTCEDVQAIVDHEKPAGVMLQFGGQTSINLASGLGAKVLGTPPEAIDAAEDRKRFSELLRALGISQPRAGTGFSFEEVKETTGEIGYPVLVRPSYVLGGRGMEIVHDEHELEEYMTDAVRVSPKHPVLVDKYISDAIELDVDAVCDGHDVYIGGVMEHTEEAGVHSGDSSCVIPPQTLSHSVIKRIENYTKRIALALHTVGLINIQYAVGDRVYVLEANPRASRTVPFVSKATGVPLAKLATDVMVGRTLRELKPTKKCGWISVKSPVFPFQKLSGVDAVLGPEMKSTGEAMGIGQYFGTAYYKAMLASGNEVPVEGWVFVSVGDRDKKKIVPIARRMHELGLYLVATEGTGKRLLGAGIPTEVIGKVSNGRPDAIDLMRSGGISLVINTPTEGRDPRRDGYMLRRVAVDMAIPFITTMSAAEAATEAIQRMDKKTVRSLEDYYAGS